MKMNFRTMLLSTAVAVAGLFAGQDAKAQTGMPKNTRIVSPPDTLKAPTAVKLPDGSTRVVPKGTVRVQGYSNDSTHKKTQVQQPVFVRPGASNRDNDLVEQSNRKLAEFKRTHPNATKAEIYRHMNWMPDDQFEKTKDKQPDSAASTVLGVSQETIDKTRLVEIYMIPGDTVTRDSLVYIPGKTDTLTVPKPNPWKLYGGGVYEIPFGQGGGTPVVNKQTPRLGGFVGIQSPQFFSVMNVTAEGYYFGGANQGQYLYEFLDVYDEAKYGRVYTHGANGAAGFVRVGPNVQLNKQWNRAYAFGGVGVGGQYNFGNVTTTLHPEDAADIKNPQLKNSRDRVVGYARVSAGFGYDLGKDPHKGLAVEFGAQAVWTTQKSPFKALPMDATDPTLLPLAARNKTFEPFARIAYRFGGQKKDQPRP